MLSTIANHARSLAYRAPTGPIARVLPLMVTRTQAGVHPPATQGLRPGATSTLSRQLWSGAPSPDHSREWPADRDAWDGQVAITPAGLEARQASLVRPASPQEIRVARDDHACRTGAGVAPGLSALTTRIGMMLTAGSSTEELLERFGPGVAAGLRELEVGPGDAVAEHVPNLPALSVRLAMEGVKAFITVPYPARLREVHDELDRYREGKGFGVRTIGSDFKPLRSDAYLEELARKAAGNLVALPGSGFGELPKDVRFKALISRSAFDYLDFHAVDASVRDAGGKLQPGGGLVFEFSHSAGRPVPASAGVRLNRIGFRDLEDAVEEAGLRLRHLHVTFRRTDDPGREVIPARRVLQDADGRISLRKADAAAWSGWDEICERIDLRDLPVNVEVSGLFLKDRPAGGA